MFEFLLFFYGLVTGIGVGIGIWAMWTNREELSKESWWTPPCVFVMVFVIAALWPIWLVALILDSA